MIGDQNVPDLDMLLQWNVYGSCTALLLAAAFLARLRESPFEHGKDSSFFAHFFCVSGANLTGQGSKMGCCFHHIYAGAFQRF